MIMKSFFAVAPTMILVDARALQDHDYRFRGVGQHSAVILAALRFCDWGTHRPPMIALTDPTLAAMADEHALLFDAIETPGIIANKGSLFLSLSPMTHDPVWAANYLLDRTLFRVSLFYDLIQLQFPERYLQSLEAQMGFLANLAWLKQYDRFAAISRFCVGELTATMGVSEDNVFVSYVAVRQGLEPSRDAHVLNLRQRTHILFAGGGDPRKNPECAVLAHARSHKLQQENIGLVLFGNYHESTRAALRKLHAQNGGQTKTLSFLSHLPDDELRRYYADAILTIVASKAEGFSIPIVESSAANTPVLASNVGAHPELVTDAAHRFDPDDADDLCAKLDLYCFDEAAWMGLKAAQDGLWKRFTVEKVGQSFLEGLAKTFSPRAPTVRCGKTRPTLSLLSPLPPAASGVADYSAATFEALGRKADIHVYTSTVGAKPQPWFASLNSMGQAAFSARRQDATVAVLGNSHFHTEEFNYLMDTGCGAIAHDARMINYYVQILGQERSLRVARQEFAEQVDNATVSDWLHNQERLPVLFLSEIVERARPLMVHSLITAELIEKLYRRRPTVLPFAQYNALDLANARPEVRRALRHDFGMLDNEVVLCTFGYVSDDKAPDELVWATKILNDWNISARLYFCGQSHGLISQRIEKLIDELGLRKHVFLNTQFMSAERYRKMIFAADVGIQLRTYFMGGLSGALNDCIAAALPSIANRHLAEAMVAPDFVRRVPDKLSSILIAEAVLDVLESGQNKKRPINEAAKCAHERSPDVYAESILRTLGVQ